MLAPLSNLVGECRHTKVTKAKKTKKVSWHWDTIHQQAFDDVKATITRDVTLAYPGYMQGFGYFIFMVRFGQFPENGQRQIAYINNFHQS